MEFKPDPWQTEILKTDGNICVRSGRQVGKSTVIAIKAAQFALMHSNKTVMVIACVERQALLLFEKILDYMYKANKKMIVSGKDRPTKHKITLTNGSVIHCLPTGDTGYGIRGYSIDLLIVDEAAFVSEEVYTSIIPSLAVTKGTIWLLSTPHGKEGYYYRCFTDETFKSFHVSSEDCPRRDDKFLEHEKSYMTKANYAQEYLGEFVDELRQFFPDELIKKCQLVKRPELVTPLRKYALGVDIARMGEDLTVFSVIDGEDKNNLIQVESLATKHTLTTETTKVILLLEQKYHFKHIYVDSGGMGVGVFDQLLTTDATKKKVVSINDADRPLDAEQKKKKRTIKEDLYNNLLCLMEQGKIKLLDDDEIFLSLKSVQYEYDDNKFKIFGNFLHHTESIIRAAYCSKEKSLSIWCR